MKWYAWVGTVIGFVLAVGHAYFGTVDILFPLDQTHFTIDNQVGIIITWHVVTVHLLIMASSYFLLKFFSGKGAQIFGSLLTIQYAAYTLLIIAGCLIWIKSLWLLPMWIAFLPNTIIAGYMTRNVSIID